MSALRFTALALVLILTCTGCARVRAHGYVAPQVTWTLALPSGEVVTIVSETHDSFVNVNQEQKRILGIMYRTDHPLGDADSLRMEARRVFAAYKTRIDVSDYNTVELAAMDPNGGGAGVPFYFERTADNQWVLQP